MRWGMVSAFQACCGDAWSVRVLVREWGCFGDTGMAEAQAMG